VSDVTVLNDDVVASQTKWLAMRHYLSTHRVELARAAAGLYPNLIRVGGTTLLARDQWVPDTPLALDRVALAWRDLEGPAVDGSEPESASVRPLCAPGDRFKRYSDAISALASPRVFENRPVYRLATVDFNGEAMDLGFGLGRYFDGMNVGEAAAHEYAAAVLRGDIPAMSDLPFRSQLGDPTDPARRSMTTAITTVTLRRVGNDAEFLLHWRDPAKVAANAGLYQVLPVGVFQPAGGEPNGPDFSLWRGMVREFSEELTGEREHHEVDYDTWPLYQAVEQARERGDCRVYLLGLGVDPLSLATDVLTAAVFESDAFDSLFGEVVEVNAEGTTTRVQFATDEVSRLVRSEPMQPAGAAALALAWQGRDLLLPH
jgi:hypothetical protein